MLAKLDSFPRIKAEEQGGLYLNELMKFAMIQASGRMLRRWRFGEG
jgi:hypothetical protein